MLKFGLATPTNLWDLSLDARQGTLEQIHQAGFDHVFMADHVSFRDGSGTDGFVEVASLSQLHDKLGVMISIYLLPLRHPLPVARQLVTMDRIAPGRMTFGIGIGGEDRHEVEICGVDPKTRGVRTNEMLDIIRKLLAGEEVTHISDHFAMEKARIRPSPSHKIPIIVGGRSNAALKRAAQFGEGWIGAWCSDRRFKEATTLINEWAAGVGRTDVAWLHGYQPWIGVDADPQKARDVVKTAMEDFYKIPFEQFERYTLFGTPQQVAEQLGVYVEAGCRLFNLKVCTRHAEEEVPMAGELITTVSKSSG